MIAHLLVVPAELGSGLLKLLVTRASRCGGLRPDGGVLGQLGDDAGKLRRNVVLASPTRRASASTDASRPVTSVSARSCMSMARARRRGSASRSWS